MLQKKLDNTMSCFTKGGGAFVHDGEWVAYSPLDTQFYFVVLMG